jgi:purine catabolism regulator
MSAATSSGMRISHGPLVARDARDGDEGMSITINELVALPSLRTRFLAGEGGRHRAVHWAHTCELPDPWNWLGTGDLLLSDGYNFPAEAEKQAEFLEALAQAALSGVAFAEGMHAPSLTVEGKAAADALAFPVLETAYAVPFVTVVRTVADSNSREASARLLKIIRLYDVVRRAHQAKFRGNALIDQLSDELGTRLYVADVRTGQSLLPTRHSIPDLLRGALLERLRTREGPLPTFIRLSLAEGPTLALPVEAGERAVLVVEPLSGLASPDLVVLEHVAAIAGLEVERLAAASLRRLESGGRLLCRLMDGSTDLEAAEAQLTAIGLGRRPWRLLCIAGDAGLTADDVQASFAREGTPHLVAQREDRLWLLLADEHVSGGQFGLVRDTWLQAGVSQQVHSLKGVGDAARQARWALEAARSEGRNLVVYGEHAPLFLPRTVAEGEAAVDWVLGPVIAYDAENDSQLLHSLGVFLDCNMSWKDGADRLRIHRQTLVYRMHRVEELTGRNLQNLEDQTHLYLALKTLRMLNRR